MIMSEQVAPLPLVPNEEPHAANTNNSQPVPSDIIETVEAIIDCDSDDDSCDGRLPYNDHNYLSSSSAPARRNGDSQPFPVIKPLSEMPNYVEGEVGSSDGRSDMRLSDSFRHSHGRMPYTAAGAEYSSGTSIMHSAIPIHHQVAPGIGIRKVMPLPGQKAIYRGVIDSDFANLQRRQTPYANVSSVTIPKQPGRPKKEGSTRLLSAAIMKQQVPQYVQVQSHPQLPNIPMDGPPLPPQPAIIRGGPGMSGVAPLITSSRGQRPLPRGKGLTGRRDLGGMEDVGPIQHGGVVGQQLPYPPSHMQTVHPRAAVASSPRKAVQPPSYRNAQAAEEAHKREMEEAAKNALASQHEQPSGAAPNPVSSSNPSEVLSPSRHPPSTLPIISPPPNATVPRYPDPLPPHHIQDGQPRPPGRSLLAPPNAYDRRTMSESQGADNFFILPPNQQGPAPGAAGIAVGTPRQRGRPRGSVRSRSSLSSSTALSTGSTSSPSRGVVQTTSAYLPSTHGQASSSASPVRRIPIQSPKGPQMPTSGMPSTMASAAMAMSSPLHHLGPSLPSLPSHQLPVSPARNVLVSPPRPVQQLQQQSQGLMEPVAAAPLISNTGSTSYMPRGRKRKSSPSDAAAQLQAEKIVGEILKSQPINNAHNSPDLSKSEKGRRGGRKGGPAGSPLKKGATSSDSSQDEGVEGVDWVVDCICGSRVNDEDEGMVGCDAPGCIKWQHLGCIYGGIIPELKPDSEHFCTYCRPRKLLFTSDQAARWIKRRAEEREQDLKKKLEGRKKTRDAEQRKSGGHQRVSQHSALLALNYNPIEKNEYSSRARRLLSVERNQGGGSYGEVLRTLKDTPRVTRMLVTKEREGLVSTQNIEPGSYIVELIGNICLPNECDGRGNVNSPFTFLFTTPSEEKIVIDARKSGNDARFVRRSCKHNAELALLTGNEHHIMLVSSSDIDRGDEITIPFDADYTRFNVRLECACNGDGQSCEIALFNESLSHRKGGTFNGTRRSLPANGASSTLTPKGAQSPPRKAATEKKRGRGAASAKRASVDGKKGRKGRIKLRRGVRGGKKGQDDSSVAEDDSDEEAEKATTRSSTRTSARTRLSESELKKEVKEEPEELKSPPRRGGAGTSLAAAVKEELKSEPSSSVPGTPRRGAKAAKKEEPEEAKAEPAEEKKPKSAAKPKKEKKALPEMNYTLPSERNKTNREDAKIARVIAQLSKAEVPKQPRGSLSGKRGEKSGGTGRRTRKESAKQEELTPISGRGKRRGAAEESVSEKVGAAASAATAAPINPRKRWQQRVNDETLPLPPSSPSASTTSISSPAQEDNGSTASSPAPSSKKKWLARHKEDEEAKAKQTGTPPTHSTPTRASKRNTAKRDGDTQETATPPKKGRASESSSSTSLPSTWNEKKNLASAMKKWKKPEDFHPGEEYIVSSKAEKSAAAAPAEVSLPVPPTPPPAPIVAERKRMSLADYKAKKALVIESRAEKEKGEGGTTAASSAHPPPSQPSTSTGEAATAEGKEIVLPSTSSSTPSTRKSFIPDADAAALTSPISLPRFTPESLQVTRSISDLKKNVYGDEAVNKRGGLGVGSTVASGGRPRTPELPPPPMTTRRSAMSSPSEAGKERSGGATSQSAKKAEKGNLSIADRLMVEFGVQPTTAPSTSQPQSAPESSTRQSRFAAARPSSAVRPPGALPECPRPASMVTTSPPSVSTSRLSLRSTRM